jgi:ubiquinone/menaquinone biosynthesis C-methylase UbiE
LEFTYHDFLASFGIGGAHPGGLALTKKILEQENIHKESEILDVGCGTGQTATYLAKTFGCKITAVDRHPLMLEKAKQRCIKEKLNINLVKGDVLDLPFLDASFDFVISESVTFFTLISKALREYTRVLRPNGILINLEMTAEKEITEKDFKEFKVFYGIDHVPTEYQWCKLIEEAGLSSVQILEKSTIGSNLSNNYPTNDEAPDFNPSKEIDPKLLDIWNRHDTFSRTYSNVIGYRVYRSIKGNSSGV